MRSRRTGTIQTAGGGRAEKGCEANLALARCAAYEMNGADARQGKAEAEVAMMLE